MAHDLWTEKEITALEGVKSFEEAADIAISILVRMQEAGQPVVQICGPMSTGGRGSLEDNMAHFRRAIDKAVENGLTVFNQTPFQDAIIRLSNYYESKEYNMDILEVFYRRVFESGHLHKILFLPDWESSIGARWERKLGSELGLTVEEYPSEWL